MSQPQSIAEFEHLHKDTVLRLENESLKLDKLTTPDGLQPLHSELTRTLQAIVTSMTATGPMDPEQVFRTAISFLPVLDAKCFLIDNLLEAAKWGEDVRKTLDRYQELGLLSGRPQAKKTKISLAGLGTELEERKSFLRRIALYVARIGVNAIKSIPKWIEVEPQITLLPFPTLSFVLKGAAMSVQDLLDTLTEGSGRPQG